MGDMDVTTYKLLKLNFIFMYMKKNLRISSLTQAVFRSFPQFFSRNKGFLFISHTRGMGGGVQSHNHVKPNSVELS